jgi:hypothetical protein
MHGRLERTEKAAWSCLYEDDACLHHKKEYCLSIDYNIIRFISSDV